MSPPPAETGSVSIFRQVAAPAPRYLMRLAEISRLVDLLPREIASFLEIGPGMGDLSLYLRRRFPEARGVLMDFSGDSAAILRRRFAGDRETTVLQADFQRHSHEARYDLIVACEVLEHIEDDVAALAAIHRLLAPGGHFIFSVPAFMRKWQHADEYAGHYRRYEWGEIVAKFEAAGLRIERLWCYGFPVTELLYPLRQLYYGRRGKGSGLSKQEATKRSGVERTFAAKLRRLPMAALLTPFFHLQHWARHVGLGDGFLVLARRPADDAGDP